MTSLKKLQVTFVALTLFITTPLSSAISDENLQVPAADSIIGGAVREDLVKRTTRLMKALVEMDNLPISISYSSPSIIDLGLVCDASRDSYIGAYFIFILKEDKTLNVPYHQVVDADSYQHNIRIARYSGAVKFYYRSVYDNISSWGDNFSRVSVSPSSYDLTGYKSIPPTASSSPAEVRIDRKTGVANVETLMTMGTFNDWYNCTQMSEDWTGFTYNFYEAISFKAAAVDWLEAEADFASERDQPSKF
jgi:hypothetical protein